MRLEGNMDVVEVELVVGDVVHWNGKDKGRSGG